MKSDIILAGVGGQGILSIATVLGFGAIKSGLFLKQAEVHGMSQRGGDVSSNLRISEKEIFSDLIPFGSADLIISVEPMEALRYLPKLSEDGWIVTNTKPFENIPNYPELDKIYDEIRKIKNHVLIDADSMAKELGNSRVMNIIMLGAASKFVDIDFSKFEDGIKFIFGKKGQKLIDLNLKALKMGRDFVDNK